MSRYFFNVINGVSVTDRIGAEFATLGQARREAVRLSGENLSRHAGEFWADEEWRMDVTDEAGLTLFALHFWAIDAPVSGHTAG